MTLSSRFLALAAITLGLAATAKSAATGAISFPARIAIPAQLALLKEQGAVGRSNPFYKGYRPTFFFAGGKSDVMCTIQLPADLEKVNPGETVDVGLECIEPLSIKPEKPGFLFKEGGRTVGKGALKLPAP